ncbi:hypothetical protein AURDEDRAFT_171752 [Auricularia subglabra TFB-10046 SS5]|nr:hypothetical protein AURDEDRAFT_171752 [Auricularia subglabra TFB-10046 SS5]
MDEATFNSLMAAYSAAPADDSLRPANEFMAGLCNASGEATAPLDMTTAAVYQQHTDTSVPQPPAAAYAFSAPPRMPPVGTQTAAGFYSPVFTPAAAANAHPQRYPPNRAHAQPAMGPHSQTTAAPRQGVHGSGPSAPRGGHRYTVPTPLPPRRSLLAASPPTRMDATPSPLPGTPSLPLFPAQAGPPMPPPLSTHPLSAPPLGTLMGGGVFAPSTATLATPRSAFRPLAVPDTPFTMFAPPAPSRPVPAPSTLPGQSTTRIRKIAPAPTRRTMPTPSAPQHMPARSTLPPPTTVLPVPPPGKRVPRQKLAPATTALVAQGVSTLLPQQVASSPPLPPPSHSPTTKSGRSPSAPSQAHASALVASDAAKAGGQQRKHGTAQAAEPAKQRKRARPDAGNDAPTSTKRTATDETWPSRFTLDSAELSVPVGHGVQSHNNTVPPQRSHALKNGRFGANEATPPSTPPDDDDFLSAALKDEGLGAATHATTAAPAPAPACTAPPAPMQGGLCLPPGGGICRDENRTDAQKTVPVPAPAPAVSLIALPTGGGVRGITVGKPTPVKRADGAPQPGPSGATSSAATSRAPAGPSPTAGASGSRSYTGVGGAQSSGAAAGPSKPPGPNGGTKPAGGGNGTAEGGEKAKKKKKETEAQKQARELGERAAKARTNALGCAESGVKRLSWML